MTNQQALYFLAEAVAIVAVAGDQGPITIESIGPHDLRLRRVRVTQVDSDGSEAVWEGPLADWQGAVAEAATRPAFPGAIPGWTPGPYESAARQRTEL